MSFLFRSFSPSERSSIARKPPRRSCVKNNKACEVKYIKVDHPGPIMTYELNGELWGFHSNFEACDRRLLRSTF